MSTREERKASRQAALTLPIEERRENRMRARALVEEARARILESIEPPALSGSEKQVAWATDIRSRCISVALGCIGPMRDGTVAYALSGTPFDDPLVLRLSGDDHEFDTEQDLLDALSAALTTTDSTPEWGQCRDRTAAAWWINHNR